MQFHYNIKVMNVEFDLKPGCKQATRIELQRDGQQEFVDLTENDLVFITPGGCVENSTMGSQNTPAAYDTKIRPAAAGICGGGWRPRTLLLATRTSSALTQKRPTGCLRPWKHWTTG